MNFQFFFIADRVVNTNDQINVALTANNLLSFQKFHTDLGSSSISMECEYFVTLEFNKLSIVKVNTKKKTIATNNDFVTKTTRKPTKMTLFGQFE